MVPMRAAHRVRLSKIRRNMRGRSVVYRTANSTDGAKSFCITVPPIGAGNKTIFFLKWLINAGVVYRLVLMNTRKREI